MIKKYTPAVSLIVLCLLLPACGGATRPENGRLNVLATTSIVGDVVAQVGGDAINLTVLLPIDSDPHTFSPNPQDAVALSEAEIIFANGAGLEEFLPPLLESTGMEDRLIEVSIGINLLEMEGDAHSRGDPHTWMDPNNVILWTENIAAALIAVDPEHSTLYQENTNAYIASLQTLDEWIQSEVTQVPVEKRVLVADHAALGYFAARYGFEQGGSITGSFSSEAAPSAQELAMLEDKIRQERITAIFVTEASNQALAEQVAMDTGINAVWLQIASLTGGDGVAPSYLELMRYNVQVIIEALK